MGFELRIADDKGRDVAAGEPGEVVLRGGSIMAHYLDDPRATAEALNPDGWLRTGDLGVLDDRLPPHRGSGKDMFIVGGFNAYPAEIENMLLRHPDIQQSAVIGVPDERLGEVDGVRRRPARRDDGPRHRPLEPRSDGELQGPPWWRSSTSCPSTPPAR